MPESAARRLPDRVSHWMRQLSVLRAQAVKRAALAPTGDLLDGALATCDSLLQDLSGAHRETDQLRAELRDAHAAWDHLFSVMPGACLLTDSRSTVLNANRAAGALLNVSAKHLKDRQLVVFSEDRVAFAALLRRLDPADEAEIRATLAFRPRERRPAGVDLIVVPIPQRPIRWLWFLTQIR